MRDASEKRKELDQQRADAVKQLREKQLAFKNEINSHERAKCIEAIEALQSKIRELEKKADLEVVRHEELMIEMAAMKKAQGVKLVANPTTGQIQWKPVSQSSHQEVQTSPDSNSFTSDMDSAKLDCMNRLEPFAFESFYPTQSLLGYRSIAYSQRSPNMPCLTSRYSYLDNLQTSKPHLTRHRSLSSFPDHENAYLTENLFAVPHYPYSSISGKYITTYPNQSLDYCHRSLSQTNIPARLSYSTDMKCMPAETKPNYWGFHESMVPSGGNEVYWPKTPSSSSDSNQSEFARSLKKSLKKPRNQTVVGNLRNFERWPKSLETLPKTPTDYQTLCNNYLSNVPLFPCDALGIDLTRQPGCNTIKSMDRLHNLTSQRPIPTDSEIDRIMAKIEQDNRVLAELDKTRANVGGIINRGRHRLLPKCQGRTVHWDLPDFNSKSFVGVPPSTIDLQRAAGYGILGSNYLRGQVHPMGTSIAPVLGTLPSTAISSSLPGLTNPYLLPNVPQTAAMPSINYPSIKRIMPPLPGSVYDLDTNSLAGLTTAEQAQLQQLVQQQPANDNTGLPIPDMLDIPGKGRCYVYIARYSYDPFQQSLNENPEAELPINAGDYLLVWGNIDEDGFCDGELLDGRRGLVPSNYIQKLVGDDLLEFHQSVVLNLRDVEDCSSTIIPQDLDMSTHNHDYLGEGVYRRTDGGGYIDLEAEMLLDDDEPMNESMEGAVPAPKQLTLERQLNKSVLIGWNHPDTVCPVPIESYHVYVDGVLKTTVKASERPRALVEGVDSNRPHRISVRSVTQNRRTSRDAACTMVIGKDVPPGPTCIKASNITSTSAVISWLPSNSNHQHVVSVNNVQVRTVKPGVYRHTITGLTPNTVYRVSVRAKNIRAPSYDEKSPKQLDRFSCHMDFRTLSKGKGLPEAPCDIQVEPGPQDGSLLVTWVPVSYSSAVPITGYAVYADGKKVTDIDSPTGDHALIDIGKLIGLNPKQVTVRTKTRDSQSGDSPPALIPQNILRGRGPSNRIQEQQQQDSKRYQVNTAARRRPTQQRTRVDQLGQVVIETEENLSDKEVYPSQMKIPAIEITKDTGSDALLGEDDFGNPRGPHGPYDSQMRGHDPRRMDRGRGPPQSQHEREGYHMDSRKYRGPGHSPSQQRPMANKVRWFVALFDYDPTTMSPNPDACEEELPFNQGDHVKVYGDKDEDGFYWGECKGRRGYVPHNMVQELVDKENSGRHQRWGDTYLNMPMKKMVALYDYDPQELSPNVDNEAELSFRTGDIIYVYGEMDEDGFYMGELDEVRGLVPSNFLEEAPDYDTDTRGGRSGRGHGPGARGPPPPPRNDPNRRRDTSCPPHTPRTARGGMGMMMGRGQPPGPIDSRGDPRRIGRGPGVSNEGPPLNQYNMPNQYSDNNSGMGASTSQQHRQQGNQQQRQAKGVPAVVPDFIIPNNKESPTQQPQPSSFQTPFQAPNIMGKLSELTSSGSGAVEAGADLFSKGKELIFMKFGLGGKS